MVPFAEIMSRADVDVLQALLRGESVSLVALSHGRLTLLRAGVPQGSFIRDATNVTLDDVVICETCVPDERLVLGANVTNLTKLDCNF